MYKNALNIGTLAGITSFVLFLLLYYIGLSPLGMGRFLAVWIPIVAVIWTCIRTRDSVLGGTMSFMQAFRLGCISILVWATFKGFCIYIYTTAFPQHVIQQYLDHLAYLDSISPQDYDMEAIEKDSTPWNIMFWDISQNIIFGTFISAIVAFITKRLPKKPTNPPA